MGSRRSRLKLPTGRSAKGSPPGPAPPPVRLPDPPAGGPDAEEPAPSAAVAGGPPPAPTAAVAGGPPLAPTAAVAGGPPPAPTAAAVGQVLPMYFVGDESHSMAGDPIAAVNQGLVDLRDEVAKHPLIGKKVRFGIVTFADSAQTRLELSELTEDLIMPVLAPRGRGTSYAAAFEALRQTLPADVAMLKAGGYQVHRPAVFFLSDGQPTDNEDRWRARLADLRDAAFKERPNLLAFGVGDADAKVIQELASGPGYAFMMREGSSTAGAISEFAASMLNSMVSSAEQLDRGSQTLEFEKPEGFVQLDAPLV